MHSKHILEYRTCNYRGHPLLSHGLLVSILYAQSHEQNNTNHSVCYTSTSGGTLVGMETISMLGSLTRLDPAPEETQVGTLLTDLSSTPQTPKQKQKKCFIQQFTQ